MKFIKRQYVNIVTILILIPWWVTTAIATLFPLYFIVMSTLDPLMNIFLLLIYLIGVYPCIVDTDNWKVLNNYCDKVINKIKKTNNKDI